MIFPALVFLGLKNNDCCGCCGNESCGKRFAVSEGPGQGAGHQGYARAHCPLVLGIPRVETSEQPEAGPWGQTAGGGVRAQGTAVTRGGCQRPHTCWVGHVLDVTNRQGVRAGNL